jgi:vanillate O-demethylase monooxygenase subunit
LSELLAKGVNDAFQNEDEPMIEDCQKLMGTTDLMSLKPVLLPTDAPAIRARRVLASLREKERQAAARPGG